MGVIFLSATVLVAAGDWGYDKLKDRKLAAADGIAAEMDGRDVEVLAGLDGPDDQ